MEKSRSVRPRSFAVVGKCFPSRFCVCVCVRGFSDVPLFQDLIRYNPVGIVSDSGLSPGQFSPFAESASWRLGMNEIVSVAIMQSQ